MIIPLGCNLGGREAGDIVPVMQERMIRVAFALQPSEHTTQKHLRVIEPAHISRSVGAVAGLDEEMQAGLEYLEGEGPGKVQRRDETVYVPTCERLPGREHSPFAEAETGLTLSSVGPPLPPRFSR